MFNQRKNKRFSYKPRFKGSNSDSYQEDLKNDMATKWKEIRGNSKRRGSFVTSLPFLVIILVALFILIYILNGYR